MNARLFFKTIKGFLCMIGGCALIFILVNSFMNVYKRKNELADVKKQKEAIEELVDSKIDKSFAEYNGLDETSPIGKVIKF